MGNFKGTTGVWLIKTAKQGETKNLKIKEDDKLIMIESFDGKGLALMGRIGEPEQEANAKIISVAPVMLHKLQQILSIKHLLLYPDNVNEEDKGDAGMIAELLDEIEETIKKATE